MKKTLILVLAIIFLISPSVYADNPAVNLTAGIDGNIVTVTAVIRNNPGIAGFKFSLSYDTELFEPYDINFNSEIPGMFFSNLTDGAKNLSSITAIYVNTKDFTADGELFSVRFSAKGKNSSQGSFSLSYGEDDVLNQNYEKIKLDMGFVSLPSAPSPGSSSFSGSTLPEIITPTPPPPSKQISFADLEGYSWAEKEILALAEEGVIKGTGENNFSPAQNIKRGDFILLLMRSYGINLSAGTNFSDVPEDSYYYNAIGNAKALGYVTGTGDGKFEPESFISRQDMFVMMYRILKANGEIEEETETQLTGFSDASLVSDYAFDAVSFMVGEGYVKGSGGFLNPLGSTTRAETAVFLYRVMN